MQVVYSLAQGGSERVACELAKRIHSPSVRCSVCAVDLGGSLAEELCRAGISSHVIGRRVGFDWRVFPALYRLFRRERVTLVQTHHLTQLIYSGVVARLAGAMLVHVEHEYFSLGRPRLKRLFRALAPLCYCVVVPGSEIRKFLLVEVGLPPSKVIVIPNGVDVTRYSAQPQVPREMFGLPPGDRLIGHVARLDPAKDQRTLLKAFQIILNTYANARLVIAGGGPLRDDLGEFARGLGVAGRVHFLGLRKDVHDLMPHLEVFALSSINEGLPLALLEAMACARPVVATGVGDVSHVIRDGLTGLTVPPGNAEALAGSIAAVLDHPAWGREMGEAARRVITEKHSLATMVEAYQSVYRSALHGGSARW